MAFIYRESWYKKFKCNLKVLVFKMQCTLYSYIPARLHPLIYHKDTDTQL